MPKISAERKEQVLSIVRHPVQWMKGEGLPPEKIRPWEMAAHIVPNFVTGFRNGFTWNAMYLHQNVYGLNKRQQTVIQLTSGIFDGINDPIIGAYMDTKFWPLNTHRRISRVATVTNSIFTLLIMFSFNMTLAQLIFKFIACNMIKDLFGTPAAVSNAKIWANATPHSEERRKLAWASGLGVTIHEMLMPLYLVIIGLRDVFGWEEQSIYIFGAAIFFLPATLLDMWPSFVRQRIPDSAAPPVKEHLTLKSFIYEMKECFSVIRHNKYFMLNMASRFITVFTPGLSDNDFYRYCGVDEVINTSSGRLRGEFLLWFRDNIVSIPCNFIMPFALPIIKKVGGARNMQVIHQSVLTVCNFLKYLVGMKTPFGVFFNWGMEMLNRTFGRVQGVAGDIIKYDMLDYVEWKTGRRSEGVNMAIDGLMSKIVLNNLDMAVGNLVIDALGFDPKLENNQPERFYKWAPVLYLLVPAIDNGITLIARILYKYPDSLRNQVEMELKVIREERMKDAEANMPEEAPEVTQI